MAKEREFKKITKGVADTYFSGKHEADTQPAYTPEEPGGLAVPAGAIPIRREFRKRRAQLLFKQSLWEKISTRAKANGISVNQLVNSILDEYEKQHNE